MIQTAFVNSYLALLNPQRPAVPTGDREPHEVFQQAFEAAESAQEGLRLASRAGMSACEPASLIPPVLPAQIEHPAVHSRCSHLLKQIQETASVTGMQVSLHLASGFAPLAAALPGQVWVDVPRVEKLSDGALCFLLAHEMGHLVHQDHAAHFGREMAIGLLMKGTNPLDFESMEAFLPLSALHDQMDQEMEQQADRFAGQVSRQLGFDPAASAQEVLNLLYSDPGSRASLEKSHGTLSQRLQAAQSS